MLKYFELSVLLLLALGVITQVLIPAIRNTPCFPMFREEAKLKAELAELNQEELEQELAKRVREKSAALHSEKVEKENKETV
jgi:hypothetical protein